METNCIFCKIIAGEIPSKTIYEDEEFKVIIHEIERRILQLRNEKKKKKD